MIAPTVGRAVAVAACAAGALTAAAAGTAVTAAAVSAIGPLMGWATAAGVHALASGVMAGGVGRAGRRQIPVSGWRGRMARAAVSSRWSYVAAAVCGPVTLTAVVRVSGGRRVPLGPVTGWACAFGLSEAGWQTLVVSGLLSP